MREVSRTATRFLHRLGDPLDGSVWNEFDARYRSIIVAFCRRLGLGEADAADVAQESIIRFIRENREGRYDRERGRLRTWLLQIVRTQAAMSRRKTMRRGIVAGDSVILELSDDRAVDEAWDAERDREILRRAMLALRSDTRLNDSTIRAFEALCVHGLAPATVAEELGISVSEAYVAKSRVARRLRELCARIAEEYAGEEMQ